LNAGKKKCKENYLIYTQFGKFECEETSQEKKKKAHTWCYSKEGMAV